MIDWSGDSAAIAGQINGGGCVTYAFGGEVSLSGAEADTVIRPELQAAGDFTIVDGQVIAKCGRGYVTIRQSPVKFDAQHAFASLHDCAAHMKQPAHGRFHKTLHEDFDAIRAYAKGTEFVKEQDGFRYPYFYRCLNRNTRFARSLVDQFGLKPGSRFVDLACGTGWMAYLMAEQGLESHASDIFSTEYFPAELKAKVHYFQADIFDALQSPSPYDLVFLRGLSNEHRADEFDPVTWRVLFENLERMAGESGVIYWIMMGGPGNIHPLDKTAARFFPYRSYRISGYNAAIWSKKPLPEKRKLPVPYPAAQIGPILDTVFADLEQSDRNRLARGVFSILNEAFAAIAYDFSRPVAVHRVPLAHKYFEWAARSRSFIKYMKLERLKPEMEALIVCGDEEAAGLRQRFPNALIFPVGQAQLLDAWVNCPDFFTSEDQDGNYFEDYLRKVRERYDTPAAGAAAPAPASPA